MAHQIYPLEIYTYATIWENKFEPATSGKYIISGKVMPTANNSKWAFLQIQGKNSAGEVVEFVAVGSDSNKNLSYRTNGNYTSLGEALTANKEYSYELIVDMDAKDAILYIDGKDVKADLKSVFSSMDITSIDNVYMITAVTDTKRRVIATLPYVGILDESVDETTTATTTETTTESTTVTTTETTTEVTTEQTTTQTTTETTSEVTTAAVTEAPVAELVIGDSNANGGVDADDCAMLMQRILTGATTNIEKVTESFMNYLDVNGDGRLDSADSAYILQKSLDQSFIFPVEKKKEN